jgi:hypothetical protein
MGTEVHPPMMSQNGATQVAVERRPP